MRRLRESPREETPAGTAAAIFLVTHGGCSKGRGGPGVSVDGRPRDWIRRARARRRADGRRAARVGLRASAVGGWGRQADGGGGDWMGAADGGRRAAADWGSSADAEPQVRAMPDVVTADRDARESAWGPQMNQAKRRQKRGNQSSLNI